MGCGGGLGVWFDDLEGGCWGIYIGEGGDLLGVGGKKKRRKRKTKQRKEGARTGLESLWDSA